MRNLEASTLHLLGDIAATLQPPALDEAGQHYRQALGLAEELGMRPLAAHCHLALGKLSRSTGQRQQAQERLTVAATMYREMGMTYWMQRAEAEIK